MAYRQINVRSPFYVEKTTSEPVVQLNLRVWVGDVITDKPTDAIYTLEKETTDGSVVFEVSELVKDYIEQSGDYTDGAVWVETSVGDFSGGALVEVTYLATEGYDTHREDMSHNSNSWSPDYVMLPRDIDGSYRITGAEGVVSRFQVLANSENSTDWSYEKFDRDGVALLAEKANLFPYSEDFSKWVSFSSPNLTNGATDPNGGANAYLLRSTEDNQSIQYAVGVLEAVPHTQSIYVKHKRGSVNMQFNNTKFATTNSFLITSSGVVAETPLPIRVVESVGGGWYRISVTYTPDGVASSNIHVYGDQDAVKEGFYVFGAQLETGSSTDDYIMTDGEVTISQPPSSVILPSTLSGGIIRTFDIGSNVGRIDFDLDGESKTVYHDVFDCNKYNKTEETFTRGYAKTSRPVILSYVNKQGAKNTFAFTLKHTQSTQSKSSNYSRNTTDYTNLTRNKNLHSTIKAISHTKQEFTINTDFISEYYVEQLEELILSEYVWAYNPIIDNEYVPVVITDKKVLKKNHLNDKLIQYTISYEVASNYINTIR